MEPKENNHYVYKGTDIPLILRKLMYMTGTKPVVCVECQKPSGHYNTFMHWKVSSCSIDGDSIVLIYDPANPTHTDGYHITEVYWVKMCGYIKPK